jgi:hypothetical protein
MPEETKAAAAEPLAISEEKLKQAEAFIEADEGAINRLFGIAGIAVSSLLRGRRRLAVQRLSHR